MESAQPEIQYKRIPGRPWGDLSSHAKASTPEELQQERETSANGKPSDMSVKSKPRWNKNARQFVLRETARRECPPPCFAADQINRGGSHGRRTQRRILCATILAAPKRSEFKGRRNPALQTEFPYDAISKAELMWMKPSSHLLRVDNSRTNDHEQ